MKIFGGLNINYDNFIYLSIIDSSGTIITKTKLPNENNTTWPLCSFIYAFSSAYRCPFIVTLSKSKKWEDTLLEELRTLPINLISLNPSQNIKADFYKNNPDPLAEYDPYEDAIKLALLGALCS